MLEIPVANTGELAGVLSGLLPGDSVHIVDRDGTGAVVLPADDYSALVATLVLLSKNGALAAMAEGLADLAAGRTEDWVSLRTEFGLSAEESNPLHTGVVLLSHRARWDLELLPPPIAKQCCEELDALIDADINTDRAATVGLRMAAPFRELRIAATGGHRMVVQGASDGIRVVHIDSGS